MLSDPAKLTLLVVLTVSCLSTILFAPSTTMHNSSMKVLSPPLRQFCMTPRDAAQECRKTKSEQEDKRSCNLFDKNVVKCENVVRRAFRHMNLGGCPFQIKALTLCEDEWCHQDPISCNKRCSGVREALSSCIQQQVASYLERNGLNADGTAA